jgi:hypothetical protein
MYRYRTFRIYLPVLAFLSTIAISACVRTIEQPEGGTGQAVPDKAILASELKDQGVAPELTNEIWLNSETPLRLGELQGKVILLDFWTFG